MFKSFLANLPFFFSFLILLLQVPILENLFSAFANWRIG